MNQNKTTKYFKYAIGEIILVVIGILIALQINNWNEDRINLNKQQHYLIGLKTDLEKQITSFKDSEQQYDSLISKGESILVDYSSIGNLIEIDSINKKLSNLMYIVKYPEITTTFSELNSTGQLNLIKKKSLRSLIVEYYQNSSYHQKSVDGNTNDVNQTQIFPIIKSTVIIRQENFGFKAKEEILIDNLKTTFENNLNNSNKEFELINAINFGNIVNKVNKGEIEEARKEAELLLIEINSKLNIN